MSDVKWIKITTDIFDDEKILLIESLPDAYAIITCWFKLLCLAGKQNNKGVFLMNDKIAYTDKMLATIFRMKETTVQLALKTFEEFGMIELVDGVITIPNWNKHQSLEQLEERKEYMRKYMADYREKQKQIACKTNSKVNSKVNVNTLEEDIEEDKEIDKDINNKKPSKHKYGEYQHVLLTDDEYNKLYQDYSNAKALITYLDEYIEMKGYKAKSHYLAIKKWVVDAVARDSRKNVNSQATSNPFLEKLMQGE